MRVGTVLEQEDAAVAAVGFDPARDLIAQEQGFVGARPYYRGRLGIDANWKEGYPPVVEMPEETKRLVDRRWGEYFPKA